MAFLRPQDFSKMSFVDTESTPFKEVKMEEAVVEYRKGKRIGIVEGNHIIIMSEKTAFMTDLHRLVTSQWVLIDG